MNRLTKSFALVLAVVAAFFCFTGDSFAQCDSCATTTVAAYQPAAVQTVAYQPTVAYEPYTGWYPGRLIDRMRLRRQSRNANTTAAYSPYVTSYAPLQRTVAQTAYYQPVTTVDSCSGCTQTAYRPVIMRPVVAYRPVVQTSYTTVAPGCKPCASCAGQAVYSQATPGCSSCADGYGYAGSSSGVTGGDYVGPTTPQPQINGNVPTPATSNYGPESAGQGGALESGEAGEDGTSGSVYEPPLAFPSSSGDQLTQRPSVDVQHAVYRPAETYQPVRAPQTRPATTRKPSNPKKEYVDEWRSAP